MRLYKLKFHSALHVDSKGSGQPEVAEEFIRSDTLSAALAIGWADIFPEDRVPEGRPGIFFNPPFKVSSAFPYVGDTLLFPVPAWQIWKDSDDFRRKEMKKVRWISESLFREILDGNPIDPDPKCVSVLSGNAAFAMEDIQKNPELKKSPFWMMTERQRVRVDRLGIQSDGGLFFFAIQFFSPDAGLWFCADTKPELYSKLKSTIEYMGSTGIGADRNSGLGHYQLSEEKSFPIEPDFQKERWITLSLFNPDPGENLEELIHPSAYGLTTRSGWISNSTVGRFPVRAFTEGSCFSRKPEGRIVETLNNEAITRYDLKISHTAPRDFRAMSLPCATPLCLKGEEDTR